MTLALRACKKPLMRGSLRHGSDDATAAEAAWERARGRTRSGFSRFAIGIWQILPGVLFITLAVSALVLMWLIENDPGY